MSLPSVTVVVLNWNRAQMTKNCLKSLLRVRYDEMRILLVDNGSTEAESKSLMMEGVDFLRSDKNVGFAEGMNLGIRRAIDSGSDFVVCVNNDVIVEEDFLHNLVEPFRLNSRAAGASPLVMQLGEKNRVISLGRNIYLPFALTYSAYARTKRTKLPTESRVTQALDGCCMMFRLHALEKTGLFDPDFHGMEDIEISIRLRQEGYTLHAVPSSIVWHIGSASKGGRLNQMDAYFMGKNWPRLNRKYGSGFERHMFWLSFLILQLSLWTAVWVIALKPLNVKWLVAGIKERGKDSHQSEWLRTISKEN